MYIVGNNNEKYIYNVDFEYELQSWLKDTKFYYTDSLYQEYGEAIIVGLSYTCFSMNNPVSDYDYGIIRGSVFEKTEETKFNVTVNLNYNGRIVRTLETVNGDFLFSNLNKEIQYDIEFIDTSNKYNPKLLKSLTPEFDIEQPAKLIKFYDAVVIDNFEYYFGVYSLGEPQITLQNAPSTFVVEKISDDIYKIKGKNNNAVINFTIRLDDYREGGKLVSDELIVKSK